MGAVTMYIFANSAKCTGCGQCQLACALEHFREETPDKSAILVRIKQASWQVDVCNQCGYCLVSCPAGAIARNESGVYLVDSGLCNRCGACVPICPRDCLLLLPDVTYAVKCDACGACLDACPTSALERRD